MLLALELLACVALCSLTFRIRGGLLAGTGINIGGGQMARLTFAAAAALTAYVAGAAWWIALANFPAWWISSTFPLFGGIDLGTRDGTFRGDVLALAARGALWVILPALVLWWPHVTLDPVMIWGQGAPHWWALLVAGPLMPVAYWLGKQSGCRLWGIGQIDWCQTGEAIYGALLGVGVIAACS